MLFVDASFYLSLLNPNDSNYQKAILIGKQYFQEDFVTTQMVLGELLTVGSQRFDKKLTIEFVEEILKSNTKIVLEKPELIKKSFQLFKKIKIKDISWVDCFSFIVMQKLKINKALSFDKHFTKYLKLNNG